MPTLFAPGLLIRNSISAHLVWLQDVSGTENTRLTNTNEVLTHHSDPDLDTALYTFSQDIKISLAAKASTVVQIK